MLPAAETDVLILGGGVCGLAAASVLGERAIVLESNDRPGGLVRSEQIGGFWFDHVLHLLHVDHEPTEVHLRTLLGEDLARCEPEAWVECAAGVARFPLQMHLSGLDVESRVRCLLDFAEEHFRENTKPPTNFREMLLRTFGRSLCEIFFFPYNRKMWRRPLDELAATGFQWNIARPDLGEVLRGALNEDLCVPGYNFNGWYPRPPADAFVRGMEVLSRALASRASDLRLEHTIESIDLEDRSVVAQHGDRHLRFRFRTACLSTLPLPVAIGLCADAPAALRRDCSRLRRNRVRTVALCVRGPRPVRPGHWRYYADENLAFTRLVFMTEFDRLLAPEDGWGLLAEVVERGEAPAPSNDELIERVKSDVAKCGILPAGSRWEGAQVIVADPAYVVFEPGMEGTMQSARELLEATGITPLGRYGRWEYSSMAQVIRDGTEWAEAIALRDSARA